MSVSQRENMARERAYTQNEIKNIMINNPDTSGADSLIVQPTKTQD
jgi:hypothetical protein